MIEPLLYAKGCDNPKSLKVGPGIEACISKDISKVVLPRPVMFSCGAFVHIGNILDTGIACQCQASPLGTGLGVAPGFTCGLSQ